MDPDAKKLLRRASQYSYIGIFFGVAVAIGYFAGHWIDGRYHTDPWCSIAGLLVGIIASFRELYRLVRRGMKDEENK